MERPLERHLDNEELDALVPSSPAATQPGWSGLSADVVRQAERHLESCEDCSRKVEKYRQLISQFVVSQVAQPGPDCPNNWDVAWREVAAGLWPDLKATQLIEHAALCDHCGPQLRAAITVDDDPALQEGRLLSNLKAGPRTVVKANRESIPSELSALSCWHRFLQWRMLVPSVALLLIVGALITRPLSSPKPLSGSKFAEFALSTHRQHTQGTLALDVRSDSPPTLNEWFRAKSNLTLTLPASPPVPGDVRPFRLEGARLLKVGGKTAAYIAYQMKTGPVSLVVASDSVAVASGGVEANFKKVSFHYRTVDGYKVVTWSVHGLTYALVSQEGNRTQQSCMVCHSAMRDRDLSQTPTPLHAAGNPAEPVWH